MGKAFIRLFSIAALCLGGVLPSHSYAAIRSVSIEPFQGGERVILVSDEALSAKSLLLLSSPERIVLDFQPVKAGPLALPSGYRGVVKAVRFGQYDPTTSRIVLDVTTHLPKPSVRSEQAGSVWHYIIELQSMGAPTVTAASAVPNPAAQTYEQAEDEKPLIVIDAGHGGKDPGTMGANSSQEKTITLLYAQALRQALLRTGRYQVALTRDNDQFIMLNERVNIARQLKADMFVSLHADANPNRSAQGISIYTISETASDAESAALAARENSVDDLSGMDLGEVDKDVADVLIDLAARETKIKSAQLADIILDAMHAKIVRLEKAHRFAGFRVLKAPDVPSILIELGFLTNPTDARLLQSKEYRDLVAASITKGIDAYYVTVKRR